MSLTIKMLVLCLLIVCCYSGGGELNEFKMDGIPKLDDRLFTLHEQKKEKTKEESLNAIKRHKRQLLFPIATLLQVSFCVASPVILQFYPFFVNQGFQLNFRLPYRTSEVPWNFLGTPAIIDQVRSRTKRDQLRASYELPTETPIEGNAGITSEQFYFLIENLLDSYGYNGTGCLLHTVCELSRTPFEEDEDILHEIVHFLLTPSQHDFPNTTDDSNSNDSTSRKFSELNNKYAFNQKVTPFKLYEDAEKIGKTDVNCSEVYKFCPESPLENISEVSYEDDNELASNNIMDSLYDPPFQLSTHSNQSMKTLSIHGI